MDKSRFQTDETGVLTPITTPVKDWAFIPKPLPPRWEFPSELWPLLATAREDLARLDGVGRYVPEPGLLLRPLMQREAIRSSSLEGTYATP